MARRLTTDGPFVAVEEALGGYLFFEGGLLGEVEVAQEADQVR
jgi:hypothetical protein